MSRSTVLPVTEQEVQEALEVYRGMRLISGEDTPAIYYGDILARALEFAMIDLKEAETQRDKQKSAAQYWCDLQQEGMKNLKEAEAKIAALENVIRAARNVDNNDGQDDGWELRYALRDYDAALEKK